MIEEKEAKSESMSEVNEAKSEQQSEVARSADEDQRESLREPRRGSIKDIYPLFFSLNLRCTYTS